MGIAHTGIAQQKDAFMRVPVVLMLQPAGIPLLHVSMSLTTPGQHTAVVRITIHPRNLQRGSGHDYRQQQKHHYQQKTRQEFHQTGYASKVRNCQAHY